jgi:hypothetical protein
LGLKCHDLSIFWDSKSPIDEVVCICIDFTNLEFFAFALILNITDSSEVLLAFLFIGYSAFVKVLLLLLWFFRSDEAGSPHLRKGAVG